MNDTGVICQVAECPTIWLSLSGGERGTVVSEMLTATHVMARLKLGRTTVYGLGRRFLETGGAEGLPCRKIGRSLRFPADQLDDWMTTSPSQPATPEPAGVTLSPGRFPTRAELARRLAITHSTQSRRTASSRADDTDVQPALPFTD